jgi:hypothetical protein
MRAGVGWVGVVASVGRFRPGSLWYLLCVASHSCFLHHSFTYFLLFGLTVD